MSEVDELFISKTPTTQETISPALMKPKNLELQMQTWALKGIFSFIDLILHLRNTE